MIIAANLLIIASLPLLLYRIVKGPSWADRIIAADLLGVYLIAGLLVLQFEYQWPWDRDVVWLVLIMGLINIFGASFLLLPNLHPSEKTKARQRRGR